MLIQVAYLIIQGFPYVLPSEPHCGLYSMVQNGMHFGPVWNKNLFVMWQYMLRTEIRKCYSAWTVWFAQYSIMITDIKSFIYLKVSQTIFHKWGDSDQSKLTYYVQVMSFTYFYCNVQQRSHMIGYFAYRMMFNIAGTQIKKDTNGKLSYHITH